MRNVSTGVSNWEHLISEIMRCTAPGGYIELHENGISVNCDDGTMKTDNPIKVYIDLLRESLVKMGRPPPSLEFLKNLLIKAGLEDVTAVQIKQPIGPWAKDPKMKRTGAMVLFTSETAFESYGMAAFTRVLGMDAEKAREICEAGRLATRNKNYHTYDV